MKIVKFDDQFEVKLHNEREESAYNIMLAIYKSSIKIHADTDSDKDLIKSVIENQHMAAIQGTLNTFFYMNMIDYVNVNDLSFYKDNGYKFY